MLPMSAEESIAELVDYIIKHNKTHLIFDFDGTMSYAQYPWQEWGLAIGEELRALDQELWDSRTHHGGPETQNLLVEHAGDQALELIQSHVGEFELQYTDRLKHNTALLKQIADFHGKYHLFIWTSNSRSLIDFFLAETGLSGMFERVVTRNDVRFLKPYPDGFEVLRDPDVPKARYLLVGDSSHDRDAAKAAGIDHMIIDFFNLKR